LIVWSLDYFGRFRGEVLFLAIRTLDLYGAINVKFTHLTSYLYWHNINCKARVDHEICFL